MLQSFFIYTPETLSGFSVSCLKEKKKSFLSYTVSEKGNSDADLIKWILSIETGVLKSLDDH